MLFVKRRYLDMGARTHILRIFYRRESFFSVCAVGVCIIPEISVCYHALFGRHYCRKDRGHMYEVEASPPSRDVL